MKLIEVPFCNFDGCRLPLRLLLVTFWTDTPFQLILMLLHVFLLRVQR